MAVRIGESIALHAQAAAPETEQAYEFDETRALVGLVDEAADLIQAKGEAAFPELRAIGSRWRQGETYIFVLDPDGNMLVHPDPALEGRNTLSLKDVNGRPIVSGLIAAASVAGKPQGFYHYEWPVPGAILPRWKTSFVRLVTAPSGAACIVGSGMYNDRMERSFVMDAVRAAVAEIEAHGEGAFAALRDPAGSFIAKDTYVFVMGMDGVELVNPAFPTLEGRSLLDMTDTDGRLLNREIIALVQAHGSGWVDYMWPKPGESVSTRKSTYVSKARLADREVIVGCGVYLPGAPRAARHTTEMIAPQLVQLVREAAEVLARRGEQAYPEFRQKGSRWFRDDTYFFVLADDGTTVFHAADPAREGAGADLDDMLGRPIIEMTLLAGSGPSGEGWIHYMYPHPGGVFPAWKSTFVKRVTFPSGQQHLIGCGIYDMQMDRMFVEDIVDRAAALIAEQGRRAFPLLRDRKGPFMFMDTYVFVLGTDGTELVNGGQPALEGRNLMDVRDLTGSAVVRNEITAGLEDGSAWLEVFWYKPGDNTPARKDTYVRKVQSGPDTFIVGSGVYLE